MLAFGFAVSAFFGFAERLRNFPFLPSLIHPDSQCSMPLSRTLVPIRPPAVLGLVSSRLSCAVMLHLRVRPLPASGSQCRTASRPSAGPGTCRATSDQERCAGLKRAFWARLEPFFWPGNYCFIKGNFSVAHG